MPNKIFEVKSYEITLGYKNAATFNGVTIQFQGYVLGKGADAVAASEMTA